MTRPVPVPTPDTQPFWDACARGELRLQRCEDCERWVHYPRSWCPYCFGDRLGWHVVSGRARLHTFTISHLPAPGFDSPLVIALVDLEDADVRMMTNIVGVEPTPEALRLDMALRVVFEEQGAVHMPRFVPAGEEA